MMEYSNVVDVSERACAVRGDVICSIPTVAECIKFRPAILRCDEFFARSHILCGVVIWVANRWGLRKSAARKKIKIRGGAVLYSLCDNIVFLYGGVEDCMSA